MSRVKNSNDFHIALVEIENNYEIIKSVYEKNRAMYVDDDYEALLEVHEREFRINSMLDALNWSRDYIPEDGLPNILIEASVRSTLEGTIKRLDYLGLERSTDRPLMIVEAKRSNKKLPGTTQAQFDYADVFHKILLGELMLGEWNTWMNTIREYVSSLVANSKAPLKRVVITNGDWLIVFASPLQIFKPKPEFIPNSIRVYRNWDEVKKGNREIFENLDYLGLMKDFPILEPSELPFYISKEEISRVTFGLSLDYNINGTKINKYPHIYVKPLLHILSSSGTWLKINSDFEDEIPKNTDALTRHIKDVNASAKALLGAINQSLNTNLKTENLSEHYSDAKAFSINKSVTIEGDNHFNLVLGDKTHFLILGKNRNRCQYHNWQKCRNKGVAIVSEIVRPTVKPRSYFKSKEKFHCSHSGVFASKSSPITDENEDRCGLRSGSISNAFCEIYSFEEHLCCCACVYGDICIGTEVYNPPCPAMKNWYDIPGLTTDIVSSLIGGAKRIVSKMC